MNCNIQTVVLAGLILALSPIASVCAQTTWNNALANGDINAAGNWSAGLPSGSENGAVVGLTPLFINQVFNNGTDNRAAYLVTGAAGVTIKDGGAFTYGGNGLYGTTIFDAGGASVITQTGGALTHDGGVLCLIGHGARGTYNISGGTLMVTNATELTVDYDGVTAAAANGSSLNISGSGRVDVETGVDLKINAGGTLNVTGNGLLVWHDRLVAEATFTGTVNAQISQVGADVHFTAPSPPGTPGTLMYGK